MKLNAPKVRTFWVAVIVAAVGVVLYATHLVLTYLTKVGEVAFLRPAAFLLVVAAFVLLCLGVTLKGL